MESTPKEMFRDVLQQLMESELDTELGYEKSQWMSDPGVENKPRNYHNGYSKKRVKTHLGADQESVRCRHLAGAGEQDQREDHARSYGVAEPAAGDSVSVRISGRHPLQGEGKPPVSN